MKTTTKILLAAGVFSSLLSTVAGGSTFAAEKEFTIKTNYALSGADNISLAFELQNVDGTVVQTKAAAPGEVSFDPISFDDADSTSHFYKIVQKNSGVSGVKYDGKTVYVRIVPSQNLLAYQDDETYKYVNDGSGPHPYNATEAELQGQAYAVYDSETKVLTFFRDEENKYTDKQVVGNKKYYTDFEDTGYDGDYYYAPIPSWQDDYLVKDNAIEVKFDNPIRPVGIMRNWFSNFTNLEKADFSKLDTSRVTNMQSFCARCEKLDTDISHLDMSSIDLSNSVRGLAHFMEMVKVQEFDFNNYNLNMDVPSDSYPFEAMMTSSGLRYLNTVPLKHEGTSAMFSSQSCLERLVVGQYFTFYRGWPSSGDWLKIEENRVDKLSNFFLYDNGNYVVPVNAAAAGNYVRPTCNTTPATFHSSYTKPADGGIVNPDTSDDLAAINLAAISVLGIVAIFALEKQKSK